jgi:uncharacterized protein (TIGR02996 family)
MRLATRIKERVRREFFPEDFAAAIQILTGWSTKDCAPGEDATRMQYAALNLARGAISNLEGAIALAKTDFRDLLMSGERSSDPKQNRLHCVVCEPGEAVSDPTERAFLESIRANPIDNTTRLVYADWLQDRDDPRADYLRVLCQWLDSRRKDEKELIERERELRPLANRRWLAEIRGMPVREKARR